MQNISDAAIFADSTLAVSKSDSSARAFTLDTSLVLFFLAMDIGQGGVGLNTVSLLSGLTLAVFIVLPYFLPITSDGRGLVRWIVGRMSVAGAGFAGGLALGQATGNLLPEAFSFVPMSLLIVAAIICCNIQIYGILRNRLAR